VELVHYLNGRKGLTVRYPWVVAFTFAILHGFGFAVALVDLGLPQIDIPWALLFTLITMIVVFLEHVVHSYFEVYSLKLAFVEVFEHGDMNQFFVVIICAFISLLVYHTFVGMLGHFGKDKMIHLFFKSKKP
jgi:hypothetical protein